jgi:hypothetical protein
MCVPGTAWKTRLPDVQYFAYWKQVVSGRTPDVLGAATPFIEREITWLLVLEAVEPELVGVWQQWPTPPGGTEVRRSGYTGCAPRTVSCTTLRWKRYMPCCCGSRAMS